MSKNESPGKKPKKSERKKFDIDLEFGEFHEDLIAEVLTGKMEVKTDRLAWKTGNLAVEYQCWGKPSGICATEAAHWCFNILDSSGEVACTFILPVERLRNLVADESLRWVAGGDAKASRMFLVPMDKIYELMLKS